MITFVDISRPDLAVRCDDYTISEMATQISGAVRADKIQTGDKILWLSVIQGYAILLVIIGHVNGFNYSADGELYPLSAFVHRFCYSFHMPLFMFVSGGLLYLTRIAREWKTTALYRDKAKRLLFPYILFIIIGFGVKMVFASSAKTVSDFSISGFFNAFFDPNNGPLKEMWFVGTLMWLMLCYPLYKTMLRNPWTELLLLAISLVPFVSGLRIDFHGWFHLAGVFKYAFYFIAGMLFFKYNIVEFFERSIVATVGVVAVYVVLFALDIRALGFLTAFSGILMTFAIGVRVARAFPGLFGSFRDHSFQIFLVGIFPQLFIELLVWTRVHSELLLLPFYIVSVVVALYSGVIVSKVGSKIPCKFIRWGLGLK